MPVTRLTYPLLPPSLPDALLLRSMDMRAARALSARVCLCAARTKTFRTAWKSRTSPVSAIIEAQSGMCAQVLSCVRVGWEHPQAPTHCFGGLQN
jgi:hypothetical protein